VTDANTTEFAVALMRHVGVQKPVVQTQLIEGDVLAVTPAQAVHLPKWLSTMPIVAYSAVEHGGEIIHEMVQN
jgi:hypothetical protein